MTDDLLSRVPFPCHAPPLSAEILTPDPTWFIGGRSVLVVSEICTKEHRISSTRAAGTRGKAGLMGESDSCPAVGVAEENPVSGAWQRSGPSDLFGQARLDERERRQVRAPERPLGIRRPPTRRS